MMMNLMGAKIPRI